MQRVVIDALRNARDLGGTALTGGGRVPTGVLYRGDAPMPGDGPPPGLPSWPPASVIDLRGEHERTLYGGPVSWPPSVRVRVVDLMPDLDPTTIEPGEGGLEAFLVELYTATARRGDLLVPVVEAAATLPAPVLVHCSAGKDRTAIVVALLLEVAGAETGAIIADQLRSNDALSALTERFRRAAGPDAPALPATSEAGLRGALGVWRAHPGGAAGWLVDNGLDPAHVEALRARLRG